MLGPNTGVKLLTPDGFALQGTIDDAGSASAGMYMSVAGQPIDKFQGAAREFATNFSKEFLGGKTVDPYAIYGAQAATVMLDAIEASDGSRSDVISKMFATEVQNGLLGSFEFSENGDPTSASGAVVGHHGLQGDGQARDRRRSSRRSSRRSTRRSASNRNGRGVRLKPHPRLLAGGVA